MDPRAWLREQDRAFRAVVLTGVGLVSLVAVVVMIAVAVAAGGILLDASGEAEAERTVTAQTPPPSGTFSAAQSEAGVTVTFEGGDALPAGDVFVVLDHGHDHVHQASWADRKGLSAEEPIPPGSSVTVGGVESGDELRVVHRREGDSRVLFTFTV